MFLLEWYRQWCEIRWHNKSIKAEYARRVSQDQHEVKGLDICQSCETLRHQLEIANFEKKQLLDRLLKVPEPPTERTIAPEPLAKMPRTIPWKVRQQMLEAEDRAKFAAQQQAAKQDEGKPIVDVADMERELDVASEQREATTGN